jgi:hypothetical protein
VGICQHGRAHINACWKSRIGNDTDEHPLLARDDFHAESRQSKIHRLLFAFRERLDFSLIYVATFHAWGKATWWFGATIGLVQAIFVLTILMPILPALHPRMANEQYGPTVVRQLEPPGFLGLHYGLRTPISVLAAHAIFGAILGAFYIMK